MTRAKNQVLTNHVGTPHHQSMWNLSRACRVRVIASAAAVCLFPLFAPSAGASVELAATGTETVSTTSSTPSPVIRNGADPSIMRVNGGRTFISVESVDDAIWSRTADSLQGLGSVQPQMRLDLRTKSHAIDDKRYTEVWAPEIVKAGSQYYIYVAAKPLEEKNNLATNEKAHHRMYVAWFSPSWKALGFKEMNIPGASVPIDGTDRESFDPIDGTTFTFRGSRFFVWSDFFRTYPGQPEEQALLIAQMSSPTTINGPRHVISEPKEWWERIDHLEGKFKRVNEAPEAIIDPNGQLHIVYSANGSWDQNYCLADLRLKKGGDVSNVLHWQKSSGCLFSSQRDLLMRDWPKASHSCGVGHHTFALLDGEAYNAGGPGIRHPFVYHGVPVRQCGKDVDFWAERQWRIGSWRWASNTHYRQGETITSGWSLKFFE